MDVAYSLHKPRLSLGISPQYISLGKLLVFFQIRFVWLCSLKDGVSVKTIDRLIILCVDIDILCHTQIPFPQGFPHNAHLCHGKIIGAGQKFGQIIFYPLVLRNP